MDHFPFDEFGSAFLRNPRRPDDLREREMTGPFLPTRDTPTLILIAAALAVLVLAVAERSEGVQNGLAVASISAAGQPAATKPAEDR
jgi:hypothetical protein